MQLYSYLYVKLSILKSKKLRVNMRTNECAAFTSILLGQSNRQSAPPQSNPPQGRATPHYDHQLRTVHMVFFGPITARNVSTLSSHTHLLIGEGFTQVVSVRTPTTALAHRAMSYTYSQNRN